MSTDLVFVAVPGVVTFALIARSHRAAAAARSATDVVAEAEAVVAGSADRQPA